MKKLFVLSFLLLLLSLAVPVRAADNADSAPVCTSMDPDQCFYAGDWWYEYYDGSTTTTICGRHGGCWMCLQNQYGKYVCSYGVKDGACSCDNVQRQGAGPGITDCVSSGNCKYQ